MINRGFKGHINIKKKYIKFISAGPSYSCIIKLKDILMRYQMQMSTYIYTYSSSFVIRICFITDKTKKSLQCEYIGKAM